MTHPACSEVNPRQQMVRVSWASSSLSSAVTSSSSSSSISTASATQADNVAIRRYGRHHLTQYACLPGTSCSRDLRDATTAAAAGHSVRWKSTIAERVVFKPPTSSVFSQSTLNSLPDRYYAYRAPDVAVRDAGIDGRASLFHVDPAVRGPCVACQYIRRNSQLRYQPYNRYRHYAPPTTKSHHICYY